MTHRTPGKASHLWNVQEPGDPYDIKRSMIARLPDHPNKPMSEYLEMVCLLQAAEIERLSDYLTELQYKYRQVDRRDLDRHSYEVQIKELAEKNTAYNSLKSENDRLRDYIRRQTLELEELQKKSIISMNLQALQSKYDGVLHQLGLSREQNERSEQTIAKLNYQISEWRVKWEKSQQEKSGLRTQFERQIREKVDIEVRIAQERSQERFSKLHSEIRQLRQYLESKNQQIHVLANQKDQLLRQIKLLEDKNRSRGNIQQSMNEKNREIQRLNSIISEKTVQLEQASFSLQRNGGELRALEEKYLLLEREKETLLIRVKQVEQMRLKTEALDKYQERVAMMSMEIQRLNGINNLRGRQLKEANIQIDRLRIDLKNAIQSRDQSKVDLQIMSAHQNRINVLTNELDRITLQLKAKNDEIHVLQQKIVITDHTSSQMAVLATQKSRLQQELQASKTQFNNYKTITDSQLNTLRNECHKLKYELQQVIASRGETQKYKIQCERIRVQLQRIKNESISFKRTLEEQKSNSAKVINQRNRLIEERGRLIDDNKRLGLQLVQLRRDIEQLRGFTRQYEEKEEVIRKLKLELESTQSRNSQLEGTVDNIYKEIERLHSVLSTKTNELMKITKDYTQLQQKCRYLQNKLNSSGSEKEYYEKQISKFNSQLNLVKVELQKKNNDFITERQRYEKLIIQKDKLIGEHIKQKQVLEKKIIQLQRDLAKRNPYEEEYEKARDELRIKETLILQLEKVIKEKETFYKDSEGRIRHYEVKITQWESRLKEAEKTMNSKDMEIQRLNVEIRKLNQKIIVIRRENEGQYQQKFDKLTQQNIRLKKMLQEYEKGRFTEQSLRNQLLRAEDTIKFERNEKENLRMQIVRLEETINRQSRELESLRESAKEYQMKIVHIENTNTKVLQDKLKDYEIKLQERDSLIISLQKEIKQLETQFSSFVDRDRTALSSLTKYQQKINILSIEFDRLNQVVEEKTRQLREKDRIIQSLREQLNNRSSSQYNQNYKIQNANLRTALSELQNINTHAIAERDQLFRVSHEMKTEYEENLSKLRTQMQYRIDQCRKFGEEVSILRNKEQNYLNKIKELEGLASRRTEDPSLRARISELEQLITTYTRQIQQYKNQNTNLNTQISQLELMLQEQKTKGESTTRQEITSLTIKINQYVSLMKAKDEQLAIWENKYTSLYSAYQELYNNYNLTKNQYEITIANVRVYESKLFKLEEDFNALSDALRAAKIEVEQYKKQNYSLKVKTKDETELYEKNLLLSKEIDRLTEISQRMQIQLSDTRLRLTDNVSLNKRIEEHLGLFVVLFAEIESLRGRLANSERQCQDVRRSSIIPLRVDKSYGPRQ